MVPNRSRMVQYLNIVIVTTAVLTTEVQSIPMTTNAPIPLLNGSPISGSHESPLVHPPPSPDGPPHALPAPHISASDPTIAPGVPRPNVSIAPLLVTTAASKAGAEKIDLWLAPVCEQLEKIVPKQAFKIQSQFKRIVESTNNKLSICFLEHYKFDPSLNPISKVQMAALCHSRNSPHFRAFLSCAADNWAALAEQELDAIINARDDHVKNHKHDYKDLESGAPSLLHGDDEVKSILNDVVSKALVPGYKIDHGKKNEIKLIDLSDKATAGHKPLPPSSSSPMMPAEPGVLSVERKILNDPSTVMVFVDTSKAPLHPQGPSHHSNNLFGPPALTTTAPPHSNVNDKAQQPSAITKTTDPHQGAPSTTKASTHTTSKPADKDAQKTPQAITVKPALPTTTSAPKKPEPAKQVSTTAVPKESSPKTTTKSGEPSSRGSIESQHPAPTTTTTAAPKAKTTSTNSPPTETPTEKPLETLEAVLKRQEAEKIEFEWKLKMEREALIRRLQKKQDEIDAQNAIAAMQSHRSHATDHDSRMHQIEHERQMFIDPIGHTLKHQQFEMRRQQRLGR